MGLQTLDFWLSDLHFAVAHNLIATATIRILQRTENTRALCTVESPSLSVRAIGEMIGLPAYQQSRILHDQKHPRQQPQKFRVPY